MTTVCPLCLRLYDVAHAMAGPGDRICPDCRNALGPQGAMGCACAVGVLGPAALTDALPPDVRAALDDPELETVSRECLDALIRAVTGGPGAVPGGCLYLQCHGYLFPEEDNAVL